MASYFETILSPDDRGTLTYIGTVPAFLREIEGRWGDAPAFRDAAREVSYHMLCREAGSMRGMLRQKGVREGETVAILAPNSIFAAEAFLAIASYGARALLLPAQMDGEALAGSLKKFDVKAVFCTQALQQRVLRQAPGMTICMNTEMEEYPYLLSADCAPQDAAAIFLTGGTTGTPKGAVLSHGALMRGAYNGTYLPGGIYGHTTYAVLPFCHVFGMIRSVLSFLYTGGTVCPCADAGAMFRELPVYQPDVLILVPGLAELLLQVLQVRGEQAHGGRLQTIICGGAPVPQKTIEAFVPYGVRMMAGYGLTETANLVSGNVFPLEKPGSVGKTYPEQEIKLCDGEIWVRGDHLMQGYYNDAAETEKVFSDGWLRTGDRGTIDEDGYLYITGRSKNIILLSNGENVSPEELEMLLYNEPIVKDCLVKEHEGVIAAEIQLQPSVAAARDMPAQEALAKEAVQRVNDTLPAYKRIRKIMVRMEDFEKTGSLKVKR